MAKYYDEMSDEEFLQDITDITDDKGKNPNTPSEKMGASLEKPTDGQQEAHKQHDTHEKKEINDNFAKLDSLLNPFNTSTPVEPTEFIGKMFARKYVNLIVGAPGSGKSLFTQRLFSDLSNGGNILGGFAENEPPRKCMILCGELGEQGLRERAQKFNFQHNPQNVRVVDFKLAEKNGISLMLDEEEGQENLEYLASKHPDIIFIDSFGAFSLCDENDNKYLKKIFNFLMRIADDYNVAICVIHHVRKRLSKEQTNPLRLDDIHGGNTFSRYIYTAAAIEYQHEEQLTTIRCIKSWSEYFKTISFKVIDGLYNDTKDLIINPNYKQTEISSLNDKKSTPDWKIKTIAFLQGRGQEGATNDEINKAIGRDEKSKSLTAQQLKRMEEAGELVRLSRGKYALPNDE